MARPTTYSDEVATAICDLLAEGKTLRQICKSEDMPAESTVRGWSKDNQSGFHDRYMRAREFGYLSKFDEMEEIARDGSKDWTAGGDGEPPSLNSEHIQRSRVIIDTLKWSLSKALPKMFGDNSKLALTGGDEGDPPVRTVTRIELVAATAPSDSDAAPDETGD